MWSEMSPFVSSICLVINTDIPGTQHSQVRAGTFCFQFSSNPSTAKSFAPDNGSVCSRDQGLMWEHPSSPLHAACGWDAPWMLCLSVVHWCVGVLFCYFVAKWYFTVQLHHNPPIHWWSSGHSKFEALMNEAAINIHVKVSRWTYVSISLE